MRERAARHRAARHPDAGHGRVRGLPADPRRTRATAFLPVVMITASGDQEKVRAIEAGADDFVHQAVRPVGAARAGPVADPGQALPRHHRGADGRAAGMEPRARGARAGPGRRSWSGSTGCAASSPPQLVELVVDSGDESFLESHRREIVVVFCDLRRFTAFAETSEPEEVMAVLSEYYAALGDLIHRFEGTLEQFAGDGLMVFFNDPLPCDEPRCAPSGWRSRCAAASQELAGGVAAPWARPRLLGRHRAGLRHDGPDRLRGPLRLRGDRQRHEPRVPAVLSTRTADQILVTQRVHGAAEDYRRQRLAGRDRRCAGSCGPVQCLRHQGAGRCPDPRRDRRHARQCHSVRPGRGPALRALRPRCSSAMPQVWERMRLNEEGESVVVVPSVTLDEGH